MNGNERNANLSFMFGNRERRRKEKRIMHFYFICLDCTRKGNEKRKMYGFFFFNLFTFMPI